MLRIGAFFRGNPLVPPNPLLTSRLCHSLSETLAVPRSGVTLVSGGGSRDKVVELAGIGPDEIERRLATAGGQETG